MDNRDMKSEIALNLEMITALLDPREVSAVLKVPVKAVHKLVREGKLPCVQVTARQRRFTHEQVQDYIRSQSTEVRVDKRSPTPVSSAPKKGGAKSSGVTRAELRKELRSWR